MLYIIYIFTSIVSLVIKMYFIHLQHKALITSKHVIFNKVAVADVDIYVWNSVYINTSEYNNKQNNSGQGKTHQHMEVTLLAIISYTLYAHFPAPV